MVEQNYTKIISGKVVDGTKWGSRTIPQQLPQFEERGFCTGGLFLGTLNIKKASPKIIILDKLIMFPHIKTRFNSTEEADEAMFLHKIKSIKINKKSVKLFRDAFLYRSEKSIHRIKEEIAELLCEKLKVKNGDSIEVTLI
jgi:CTP-dependent riboflavin kinase